MSVDMFMKVEGASGESQDSNHKGWTDIDSFTWGATPAQHHGQRRRCRRRQGELP